jgi:small subunit ribosomal protein S16
MALKLRMTRRGTTNRPYYHIVATDSRQPRDGNYLEQIGSYNPLATTDKVKFEADRVKHWLGVGAQPSERVAKLLAQAGLAEKPAVPNRPNKSAPKKKAQERNAAKADKATAAEEAKAKAANDAAEAKAAAKAEAAKPAPVAEAEATPAPQSQDAQPVTNAEEANTATPEA